MQKRLRKSPLLKRRFPKRLMQTLCGNQILEQVAKVVNPLAKLPHKKRYQSIKVEATTIDMPEKNTKPSTI
jgi:hypothetical protein